MIRPRLHPLTLGRIESDPGLPQWLAAELAAELGGEVMPLAALPTRACWRDQRTAAFRSDLIVDSLAPAAPEGWTLALIDADLTAPGRDFVFGEATQRGPFAVLGLARLRAPDRAATRLRVLKEALHEIGHLAGLGHCPRPRCVMSPSTSVRGIDRKLAAFCPDCRGRAGLPSTP